MGNIDTIKAELVDLIAKRDAYGRHNNEGGEGYNPYDDEIEAACKALHAAEDADLIARWPEVKARWNAVIAKYTVDGRVDMRNMPKIESEAGIKLTEVQRIKALLAQA